MPDQHVLACDLGGTRLRIALVSLDGRVNDRQVVRSPDNNPDTLIDALQTAQRQSPYPIVGAVVGVPGMVDYRNQEVVRLPNLPAWEGVISSSRLSEALGLQALLANDADLGALGEYCFGAGRGSQDMVYVAAGTGVGGGVVLNGRMLRGRYSLGEIGHTIIDRNTGETVEQVASGIALQQSLGMDVSEVSRRAAEGDARATKIFDQLRRDLAIGIRNLVLCFSPELVVVGGGMTTAGEPLLEPLRALLKDAAPYHITSCIRVALAQTGDDVGLLGAAAFWSETHP